MQPSQNNFICPLSQMLFFDPVLAEDEQTYEREMLIKLFKTQNNCKSPITRQSISNKVIANRALWSSLEHFIQETPRPELSQYLPVESMLKAIQNKNVSEVRRLMSLDICYSFLSAIPIEQGYSQNLSMIAKNCGDSTIDELFVRANKLRQDLHEKWIATFSQKRWQDLFALLKDKRIDINVQDPGGWTALIRAAEAGNTRVVKALILEGVNLTLRNDFGSSALGWATYNGHYETMDIIAVELKKRNLPVCSQQNKVGESALFKPVKDGRLDIVKRLVELNADLSLKDSKNRTVLDYARQGGRKDMIQFLEKSFLYESLRKNDLTNLGLIARSLQSDLLHEQYNPDGDTLLHLAVRHGDLAVVRILLENKADVHQVNRKYQSVLPSPLEVQEPISSEIQILLLRHPAPIDSGYVKSLLKDASEKYRGRSTHIQEDLAVLNHTVGLLLGQADTIKKKENQNRVYLAHLLSMKGNQKENLEGMTVEDFLSLRVLSYVEIWLKHTLDSHPDLPARLSKSTFLEILEREIVLACETYKWDRLIHIAYCLKKENVTEGKKAILDNFIDRLSRLLDGEELLFPTSLPGHCIYVAFYRRKNDLIARIDNLWEKDVCGRHLQDERPPNSKNPIKVYSYFLKSFPRSQAISFKDPILKNLLEAITILNPNQRRQALELIYSVSLGNQLDRVRTEGYPAIEVQTVENCVASSYSVGLQYRLKPDLYEYLIAEECALFLKPIRARNLS